MNFNAAWLTGKPTPRDGGVMDDDQKLRKHKTPCVDCGTLLAADNLADIIEEGLALRCSRCVERENDATLYYSKKRKGRF